MANSSSMWVLLIVAMAALVAIPKAEAISCDNVRSTLTPCLTYILGQSPLMSNCCGGIQGLYRQATATVDRRAICSCLKGYYSQYAQYVTPLIMNRISGLPGSCGVKIPYNISPSIDCSRVV